MFSYICGLISSESNTIRSMLKFLPNYFSMSILCFLGLNIFLPNLFRLFLYLALEALRILNSMICQSRNALLP